MLNVENIRKDFPMLQGKTMNSKPLVYLDNSATTFKPQCVIDAVNYFYTDITSNVSRGDYELAFKTDSAFEGARSRMAEFINCKPEEIVFTSGASGALNLAAFSYGELALKPGDVILITVAEHASNFLPWFKVAERTGAEVRYIPLDKEGRITVENLESVLDEKVKIVAFAAVGNVLGYIAPVKELCAAAHKVGAVCVIDGAQSVPHMKTDVQDWNCDFLAFSAHKMVGPSGEGVLYGRYELLQKMEPLFYGGGSNARFDSCGHLLLKNAPHKFESGTPNIEGAIGMARAADYLESVGFDAIRAHELELKNYLVEKISELDNVTLYNPNTDTGILAFNVKDIFSQDAAGYLNAQGVAVRNGNHCAKALVDFLGTPSTIRASVYLYNTIEEADALIEALRTCTIENCIGTFF